MISIKRIALTWLLCDLILVGASVVSVAVAPGTPPGSPTFMQAVFGLDYESNVPTWFSTLQLAFVAWVWLRIAELGLSGAKSDRRLTAGALLVSGAALFASLDEAAQLHEKIGFYTSDSLLPRTGYWMFIYLPVLLALAIAVIALIGRHLWAHRGAVAWIVGGGALFLFAAGGLELMLNFITAGGIEELVESHLEETGEMLAATMILWGSLRLKDELSGVPVTDGRQ